MSKGLFRGKAVDKASSPERLNEYIRVTNPAVWVIMMAVVVLLAGFCIWGIFGRIETTVKAVAITKGGQTVCYVKKSDSSNIRAGCEVKIGDEVYSVKNISYEPIKTDDEEDFSDYQLYVGELSRGERVYAVTLDGEMEEDGTYQAEIVTENIAPISFIFN